MRENILRPLSKLLEIGHFLLREMIINFNINLIPKDCLESVPRLRIQGYQIPPSRGISLNHYLSFGVNQSLDIFEDQKITQEKHLKSRVTISI